MNAMMQAAAFSQLTTFLLEAAADAQDGPGGPRGIPLQDSLSPTPTCVVQQYSSRLAADVNVVWLQGLLEGPGM